MALGTASGKKCTPLTSVSVVVARAWPAEILKGNLNIPKHHFIIKRTDYTEVPLYLSLSDLALFFILPVFSKSASSPIKQGEIMSMGIPIVCNSGVGDTDFVLNKYDCGVLVNNFTEKDYDSAIRKVLNTSFDKNTIRNAAKDFYDLETGINAYHKTYEKALIK